MRKPRADTDGHILVVHPMVTGNSLVGAHPGETYSDRITWWGSDGEETGTLDYVVEVGGDGETGALRLDFILDGRPVQQTSAIMSRPCRFGGRRWLAVCPATGRLVAKLYSAGDGLFRSRHAIPLAYRSQDRVPAWEKLRNREVALLERLGVIEGWPGVPAKPKRMRQPTYRQLTRELVQVRSARRLAQARDPRWVPDDDPLMDDEPIPSLREQWRAARARVLAMGRAAQR